LGSGILPWVQLIAELKYIESDSLTCPCFLGFSGQLNPNILDLESCQAHVFVFGVLQDPCHFLLLNPNILDMEFYQVHVFLNSDIN